MTTEREIQLSSIIGVILSRGVRIGLFTLGFMVLMGLYTLTIANRYQSEVKLVMNTAKIGERSMQNPPMPVDTYESILFPPQVIRDTWEKFNLDEPPVNMKKFSNLEKRITITTEEDSSSISISVELEDAELAAGVTNELATQAILLNRMMMESEQSSSFQVLESEFQIVDELTDEKVRQHREMILENRKPLVQNELDTLNTIIATNRQIMENLRQSITELETRRANFESIFSSTDFRLLISVQRNVTSNNVLSRIIDETGDDPVKALTGISYEEETINSNYLALQFEYKKLLVDLPALKEKLAEAKANTQIYEASAAYLQEKFFDMEVDEYLAQADRDRFIEIMGGVQKELYWIGTNTFSERQDLIQVWNAIADEEKVYPQRGLMVLLGGMIAFLIAFLYYLLTDLYGLVLTGIRKEESV